MRGYDRGYDYGLRGWPQARRMREPVRTRFTGGGYDRGFRAHGRGDIAYGSDYDAARRHGPGPMNRVTARYNLDYVREPRPGERPVNHAPYGGDRIGRVGDLRAYHGPYQTVGGTRTWRGEWPMGWERAQPRHAVDEPGYRNGYDRWF